MTHQCVTISPTTQPYEALECLPRRVARGPGPLEVEAAEVAGDVDDFADEIEAGGVAGFHRF